MKKDFDKWNKIKKSVDSKFEDLIVREREIWWTSFGVNIGVEINGKNEIFERPAFVLKRFNRQMVWVLPTTTKCKNNRFYEKFSFGDKEYFVALTQIRTISTKRLVRNIGMISKSDFKRIKDRIISFIQTNENPH